jgi:FkbM family methyltransferase
MGEAVLTRQSLRGTWMDVGAHHGELTIGYARHNPALIIYAVEPNLRAAAQLMGKASNYRVIPFAISESDGAAEFHLNEFEMASSLLPLNEKAIKTWVGIDNHRVSSTVSVPTIRLDTLMEFLEISEIDFLKVDTQGMDLGVVRSAGKRLRDIAKITLEVSIAPELLYKGAADKTEVVQFLTGAGFRLVGAEVQTHGQEENLTFVRV